ncbi:MAG: 4'-phosphopantetheinyl transferase superfamily protein [Gemmatimonadaceae bacterium]
MSSSDRACPQPPYAAEVIGATAPFIPGGALASAWFTDDPADAPAPPAADRALAETVGAARRPSLLAGRRALRAAIQGALPGAGPAPVAAEQTPAAAWATLAIPATLRGAPALPAGVTGSISHKRLAPDANDPNGAPRGRAIAIAAFGAQQTVGVDLEVRPTAAELGRPDIGPRILTARELAALPTGDALQRRETTLLAFALKEAVYKAIDPVVQRYVGFTEVEIDPDSPADFYQGADEGLVTVRMLFADPAAHTLQLRAMWQRDAHWIIALARATPRR